ncbi:MAG: hypothetical protein AB7O91_04620 [Sphingomonas sp.]
MDGLGQREKQALEQIGDDKGEGGERDIKADAAGAHPGDAGTGEPEQRKR